jgi:protein gp37
MSIILFVLVSEPLDIRKLMSIDVLLLRFTATFGVNRATREEEMDKKYLEITSKKKGCERGGLMKNSKIEWTDHTFNPWWGCTKVSPGCQFCYAETESKRRGHDVWGPGRSRRELSDNHWRQPRRWNREAEELGVRHRVFCASMADVFEKDAPQDEQERLWQLIEETPRLDWQLLTKRPERIQDCLPPTWLSDPLPNVWLGTSIENKDYTWRIKELVKVPAVVHFLSVEPLLGPIPRIPLADIEWVIVGGESGPSARPLNPAWVRQIRDRCLSRHIPFFFKQWGMWAPEDAIADAGLVNRCEAGKVKTHVFRPPNGGSPVFKVGREKAGRILDGQVWDQMPRSHTTVMSA